MISIVVHLSLDLNIFSLYLRGEYVIFSDFCFTINLAVIIVPNQIIKKENMGLS